ncbi:MAG: hypothetical protein ACK5JU_03445, partial [Bacteroidales bacterium]
AGLLGVGAVAAYVSTYLANDSEENLESSSWEPLGAALSFSGVVVVASCVTEIWRCKNRNRSRRIVPSPCLFMTAMSGTGMVTTYFLMREYSLNIDNENGRSIPFSWMWKGSIAVAGTTVIYHIGSRIVRKCQKKQYEPILIND